MSTACEKAYPRRACLCNVRGSLLYKLLDLIFSLLIKEDGYGY
jgi:hypothetical protein